MSSNENLMTSKECFNLLLPFKTYVIAVESVEINKCTHMHIYDVCVTKKVFDASENITN